MEKAKEFILFFFNKEAECWTKSELGNLDSFNNSVKELYNMAIDDLDEALGVLQKTQLEKDNNPIIYKPRHLYKLSAYENTNYGAIWVAYSSIKNPIGKPIESALSDGFIISKIKGEFKIIGTLMSYKDRSTMKVIGWEGDIYNPSDLDIKKLGQLVSVERYTEPGNFDNFSLEEYWKEK